MKEDSEIIAAYEKHGTIRGAARELEMHHSSVQERMKRLALKGYSPKHDMTKTCPDGFKVKGVSSLYDKDGNLAAQWVKTTADDEARAEIMRAAIAAMCESIPRAEPLPEPEQHLSSSLINCYIITDYHMGMLSHAEETGADWDLKIAEQTLVKWFEQAIAQSPNTETAVFAQLSDFLHFDGLKALTPESQHCLDADSRFYKVVRAVIRVLRRVIAMLLTKHKCLHVIMADANHDPASQTWLREMFHAFYEDEPRVTVDVNPSPYNAYEFGKTALFFHHGHKRKVESVAEVFAAKYREMFGRTKHAYAHTGHLHSVHMKENNLMIVEQHRTLAAGDAYATRGGWLSGRDAQVITYHQEYGEVSRVKINSDMLK